MAPFAAALADAAVDWREIDPDCFAAIAQNGIPMAIVAWGRDDGRRWLAQVGGIGVGFHENPALAADHAAAAHALWFGGRDEAAAM